MKLKNENNVPYLVGLICNFFVTKIGTIMPTHRILILIFILIIQSVNLNAEGFLKTSGKKIVDSQGKEIYLRGIGLGGWLVPEGYMLHTSGFANSPTQIRNKIESLIGTANTELFYKTYQKYYVNKRDVDKIAQWGFNSIRLPLTYKMLTPPNQPGVYLEEGFAIIDSLLSWCEQNKLYLILDLHCAPGAQNKDNISDSDGEARLWLDASYRTRTVDLWKKIAERYSDKEWIGGYDLINETAYNLGANNDLLRELYINITNAIRNVDANHILFIEGNWYATDFNGLTPPWDNNMVYSFHKYWNEPNTQSIQYLLNIQNSFNVPLWLGETGENSNSWFVECVELMKLHNIGWAWWPHKKIASIAGPLSAPLTTDYQKLLDYWSGSVTKPTVEFATNALIKQAEKLGIDNCTQNKDVVDALIRQPGNSETISFGDGFIPGRIYGANYDLGKIGFAYQDKVYENTGGGAVYNNGYEYRNDGVDIEKCSDVYTNGFDIGWIETGDWLKFTVTVLQEGNYDALIRIAANTAGGKILLKLDGNNFSDFITVPVTGGWQKWSTIKLENKFLSAGDHSLQIQFFFGGFNFNYLEFVERPTKVEEENNLPKDFSLSQNFPNPFNPITIIKYSLPNESYTTIKIFNSIGQEVKELLNQTQSAGQYEIPFNGSDLNSGVYFYSMYARSNYGKEFRNVKRMILLK
ncbi:MAG: cellulase family glycosylhydrolase [Ignavibacteriales bacterium]|nr:cellulase family glycosylhydrolase [Ignavibacteriales bacterium]